MPPEPRRRTTSQRPIVAPGPRLWGLKLDEPPAGGRSTGDGVPAATGCCAENLVAPGSGGGLDSTVGSVWIYGSVSGPGFVIMPMTTSTRPSTATPAPAPTSGIGMPPLITGGGRAYDSFASGIAVCARTSGLVSSFAPSGDLPIIVDLLPSPTLPRTRA